MELNPALRACLLADGIDGAMIDAAAAQAGPNGDLAQALGQIADISPLRWAKAVATWAGLPWLAELPEPGPGQAVLAPISMQYCRRNRVLPLERDNGRVRVAVADPSSVSALDDLRVLYGGEVDPVVVSGPVLVDAINRAFDRAAQLSGSLEANIDGGISLARQAAEIVEAPDLLESVDEAPIIRLVNAMIFQAAKDGASDIHVEPFERATSVRFRIDGMMSEVLAPPRQVHAALVSRIKVMADLNIAERRLPQDGGIRTRVAGRELDIRVSTVPTAHGERVVMRLLDRSTTLLGLEEAGLVGSNLQNLRRLIRQSHGIVLVTGPTGSGKTTTLYAGLSEINAPEKNIITIEDPIEYQLPGIGQIQVNPKIGLTFANGLRSVLRQDPDVIMVGEIRDQETARIATQAALTGHLVFSTLHTNDSFSSITRILDMGIEPFLVASALNGVIAQRLLRLLCPDCRVPASASDPSLAELGIGGDSGQAHDAGPGCPACRGTGYRGRTAIAELLAIDDDVREAIMNRSDAAALRENRVTRGMKTIRADGADKVRAGLTSAAEVLRVTSEDLD